MKLIKLTVALAMVGFGFLSFMNETTEPPVGLKIGDRAPEINTNLLSGVDFSSAEFKGQMILIDFWASYDANSRIGNHMKEVLLDKYKDRSFLKGDGFTIVSISLDRFRNPLIKAIENDQMNYPYHICDFNGRQSDLVKTFKAQDLKKVLVDGDGRIVAVSSNMEVISSSLQRLSVN